MCTDEHGCADTSAAIAALVEEYTQLGLVKQCEERGIATGGNKKELATRIVEYDEQTQDETLNRTDAAAIHPRITFFSIIKIYP